ncbi:glyoxalase [Mycoplasma sp. P36-A1]|uniref:glyoxalase n=1 Tax=Mycoplasma sp. P36-A1 TaxID=3252900 RepID=UPI003C2DBAA3
MINKTRVMLYVDDVANIKKFWIDNFDAKEIEEIFLSANYSGSVISINEQVELGLFPKEFIKMHSPELTIGTPSIMLFVNNFYELHDSLCNVGDVFDNNGLLTFNFPDPEDNYFVIAKNS